MMDAIMQQVSEQVKKAVEAASSAWPLCRFEYVPTTGYKPFHRHDLVMSHCHSERIREAPLVNRDRRVQGENQDRSLSSTPKIAAVQATNYRRNPMSILMEARNHPMLKRPPPMTLAPKPHNTRKYYEFHEKNGHTTAECWELRKALHELADKGQIDWFFKRGPRFLRKE
ncbi:hypothetical protein Cgig2_009099 [Carnegiea gigantea]|uniref:Retrotransposon gag domain-containing protein n=1 Tax=Carnegiea gigantea TaxID=171969 RepID=A0A9Q1QH70_9CARY|nr:hypothetical protein Cgig2_009099 [Carnegiea gigantea]